MANARKIALAALLEVRERAYSNITLNKFLSETDLSVCDRALATAVFYGVLDRTITLDYVLQNYIKTPLKKVDTTALELLRIALYQIMYMDKIPDSAAVNESVKIIKNSKQKYLSGFVNGVLRSILRSKIELPQGNGATELSIRYSCPKWIVNGFINDYGEANAVQLLEASLKTPPVTLRVNTLKTDAATLGEMLQKESVSVKPAPIENALQITNGIDITKSRCYRDGLFHVQDLASQTAISILNPKENETVLDICAAPGGKTFTMAQYMKNSGKIVACDLYEKRVQLIKKGAERLGLNNVVTLQSDATIKNEALGSFDAICCDVPCSGLGVIRRKPDIKYKDISEYTDIVLIQSKILENAVQYLNENGRILYSTCTLRKYENEGVIQCFLDKHPHYELKYQHTFMPHNDGTDGFYCALLQKSR